ncbi:ArsR/SmtB family transcription factor [Streptomyces sp. UG1]|uniref:ArsR/SmtB family transcription factor n=1 Tax=Streptomyces sp. UG1 TaxID=3417652 RepID=UPI003CFB3ADC
MLEADYPVDKDIHLDGRGLLLIPSYLARLLGHTRAAVLQALGGDCTTSELARRAGVSISSASEHAAVLRGAGLVSSTRQRNAVHHSLTPVGLALLDGSPSHAPGEPSIPCVGHRAATD